jgi:hypothetical protein
MGTQTENPTCGFAASFTGEAFEVAAVPILPPTEVARSCAETPYRDFALLFYIQRSGVRDALAAGTSGSFPE